MPLLIDFKSGDKLIINGAVLENGGSGTKLLVHNRAAILRGREVLSEEDAQTPASRTYFALQCAYIFQDTRQEHLVQFRDLLGEYLAACPSAGPIATEILGHVEDEELYKALKSTHKLIRHEVDVLKHLQEDVEQFAESAEGG